MKRNKYRKIELMRGKPLRDILIEEVDQHGSISAASNSLGVSQGMFSTWFADRGLKLKAQLVDRTTDTGQKANDQ